MKIDFVSDIACPWCAVGLYSLERALQSVGAEIAVELHFQPFELNPTMPAEGEDAMAHLALKYGATPEQLTQMRQNLIERGSSVGFTFGERARVWNTFDAHRLMYWAQEQGNARELQHTLFCAYHTLGENTADARILLRCAGEAGLDTALAREVIASGRYADEVRQSEAHFQRLGIRAVPSVVIDDQHLIQGGQPPEVFEQALRRIAARNESQARNGGVSPGK